MSTDPRPPTLEELIKILRVARGFTIRENHKVSGYGQMEVSFTIRSADCDEQGIYVRTFGSLFLAELVSNLEKLFTFENLTKQYSSPDERGATAADCISFLNNELRHIPPGGLDGTLRRRFFSTMIKKLTELQEWRVFVDRERFENLRQAQEKARKQQEDFARQQKRAEEARQKQKEPPGFNGFSGFAAFAYMSEEARRRYTKQFEETFTGFNRDNFQQNWREETFNPNPSSSQGKRWWEILGVPANANKATIKSARRKLAKIYHPDRCREAGADKKMAEINAATDEGLAGAPV